MYRRVGGAAGRDQTGRALFTPLRAAVRGRHQGRGHGQVIDRSQGSGQGSTQRYTEGTRSHTVPVDELSTSGHARWTGS